MRSENEFLFFGHTGKIDYAIVREIVLILFHSWKTWAPNEPPRVRCRRLDISSHLLHSN